MKRIDWVPYASDGMISQGFVDGSKTKGRYSIVAVGESETPVVWTLNPYPEGPNIIARGPLGECIDVAEQLEQSYADEPGVAGVGKI